ncbi:MAG: enoyl-CoA hydratase/isomerase family protein [Kofleriaceae bacterium]|nr:enoyl-CoA hydratase/isomerase family protein [Kofleriaceae bacterium]
MSLYQTILVTSAGPNLECASEPWSAGPIGTITLNRPDKKNPISPQVCGELIHAFAAIKADASARVVILTGAGQVFSAGGDLSLMSNASTDATNPIAPASLVELLTTMHKLGKPIIAMVPGPALAGGLGLMVACDLVVAADDAVFGTTEIAVGLWPMMITAEITRSVGRKKTLEMMLTGAKMTAAEALACGLVNRVVPSRELQQTTMELASKIASRSPAAMALGLRAFYDSQDMEFEPQLLYLERELGRVLALADAAEGISAFLQKRPPVWKGK